MQFLNSPVLPAVSANQVYAGPTAGAAAAPAFRGLYALDLPPVLGAKVACNGTGYSAASGAYTPVPFPVTIFDSGGLHSNTVNNSRIIIPTGFGGKWSFAASALAASSTGNLPIIMGIATNGSYVAYTAVSAGNPGTITAFENVTAGTYIELLVQQSSGATVTMSAAGNLSPFLSAKYEGP